MSADNTATPTAPVPERKPNIIVKHGAKPLPYIRSGMKKIMLPDEATQRAGWWDKLAGYIIANSTRYKRYVAPGSQEGASPGEGGPTDGDTGASPDSASPEEEGTSGQGASDAPTLIVGSDGLAPQAEPGESTLAGDDADAHEEVTDGLGG